MKSLINRIGNHSNYSKVIYWGNLLTITGFAQFLIQGIGLLTGILIIRLLPVQEYAFYTVANTMLGTMTVLGDGGIGNGVLSEGGKVWHDKEKLGVVLATGLELRKKFAVGSMFVSLPILAYLLRINGANLLTIIVIVLSLIPAFLAALSDSLLEIVPKLHQNIKPLQANQVMVSLGRLFVAGVTVFIFPFTFIALLANGIPRIYGNIRLKQIGSNFIGKYSKPDEKVKRKILKIVKNLLPLSIYYCLYGQITIWIVSIYGNAKSIAQIGALSRVSLFFTIFLALAGTLIVPRYAKLQEHKPQLLGYYFKILCLFFLVILLVSYFSWLFSDQILWIFGNSYKGLRLELFLLTIAGGINTVAGLSFSLYSCRGWTMNPIIGIAIGITGIIFCILISDISTTIGAIKYNLYLSIYGLLVNTAFGFFKILKMI